jgi:hypothetical protein
MLASGYCRDWRDYLLEGEGPASVTQSYFGLEFFLPQVVRLAQIDHHNIHR